MSGLESLAALGLACNILQLVDVGRQTISFIKLVYSNGSIDDKLEDNAALLVDISAQIKAYKTPINVPSTNSNFSRRPTGVLPQYEM